VLAASRAAILEVPIEGTVRSDRYGTRFVDLLAYGFLQSMITLIARGDSVNPGPLLQELFDERVRELERRFPAAFSS
jgi:hypothetical protein